MRSALPVLGEALDHAGVAHHGPPDPSLGIEADIQCLPGARDHAAAICNQRELRQLCNRMGLPVRPRVRLAVSTSETTSFHCASSFV